MNIQNVIKIIEEAFESNLETVILMLLVVSTLYATNILFGTLLGTFTEKFNVKKFFFGILKGILGCIGVFVFCYTLNLFSLTLKATKSVTIDADILTVVEVLTVLFAWAWDIAVDIVAKMKSFKTLKYVSYDDIHINKMEERGLG